MNENFLKDKKGGGMNYRIVAALLLVLLVGVGGVGALLIDDIWCGLISCGKTEDLAHAPLDDQPNFKAIYPIKTINGRAMTISYPPINDSYINIRYVLVCNGSIKWRTDKDPSGTSTLLLVSDIGVTDVSECIILEDHVEVALDPMGEFQ